MGEDQPLDEVESIAGEAVIVSEIPIPGTPAPVLSSYATVCSNALPFLQELQEQLMSEVATCRNGARHTVVYTMTRELISLLDATVQGDHP